MPQMLTPQVSTVQEDSDIQCIDSKGLSACSGDILDTLWNDSFRVNLSAATQATRLTCSEYQYSCCLKTSLQREIKLQHDGCSSFAVKNRGFMQRAHQ
jgi:hypothetical protein